MSKTPRATEEELGRVHLGLSNWCLEIMKGVPLVDKDGAAVLKPDGQPWLVPPSPAYISAITKFLKDNHIEVAPGAKTPLNGIAGLPEFDADGNVVPIRAAG